MFQIRIETLATMTDTTRNDGIVRLLERVIAAYRCGTVLTRIEEMGGTIVATITDTGRTDRAPAPDRCAHTDSYREGYDGELRGASRRMVRDCILDAGHACDHVYGPWVRL